MDTPKISVIMPVYNTEKYVWEAIESVLNQSFSDFEFIIIDDSSTDWSYEICEEYSVKDKRIKLFKNDENLKIVHTLNRGISLSQWKYIARIDSDDIVDLKKLEKQYKYIMQHPQIDILSSNLYFIDKDWNNTWTRIYDKDISNSILNESPICHAASIVKKEVFDKYGWYNENFNLAEDYDLWLRFFSKKCEFGIYDGCLYHYRIFDDSWKVKTLKRQLKATINVKENAIKNYWIKFNFNNYSRLYLEKFLYYFIPSLIILKLFLIIKWK